MHERSEISSFQPTDAWNMDWPYDVWTQVGVQASISGPDAATAVQDFVESLEHEPDSDDPGGAGLHYRGGYTAEVTTPDDGEVWQIVLASAGEDGLGSVQDAADDLVAALRQASGEVRLAWSELPATRARTAP
ncbi:MAG: hypothetical protein ACTH6N_04335 [Brachybacterium tyrofermentans]|uniref:Uncharacterized protein n=1 Tax=Brachybacterium tyrofermentans TaxID=47848 RepID=A0ABW0FJE0_9MICO|nr:hypothetical protein [Brachybacterium tyrofermentans]